MLTGATWFVGEQKVVSISSRSMLKRLYDRNPVNVHENHVSFFWLYMPSIMA